MEGFWRRLLRPRWRAAAGTSAASRRKPACRVEVTLLEGRLLLHVFQGVLGLNATAAPAVLVPPNGRYVPETVSGQVVADSPKVPVGFFTVTDEYRRDEPRGFFVPQNGVPFINNGTTDGTLYSFSVTFFLQAQRSTNVADGRHYDILVGVRTPQNVFSKTLPVIVPRGPLPPHFVPISTIQGEVGFNPRQHIQQLLASRRPKR
jgi:hypothetical protein